MKKQENVARSPEPTSIVDYASLIEDALTLQERDVINPQVIQYIQSLKKRNVSQSLDVTIKRLISKSLWPRLLVMRIRTVLVTLLPLIPLMNLDCLMDGLSHAHLILSYLGWVLHGLRLLINLLHLFACCIPGNWISLSDKNGTYVTRLKTELAHLRMELGNDLLWVISTLISSAHIALPVLLLDIAWIVYCGSAELSQLNRFKKDFGQTLPLGRILSQELASEITACQNHLKSRIAYTQSRLTLSLLSILSTATLTFLRVYIIPNILPMLVTNPVLPFVFALLSLMITLVSHIIGEWLKEQKPPEKITIERSTLSAGSRVAFFKPLHDKGGMVLMSEEHVSHSPMMLQ